LEYQALAAVWEITMACNMRCKHCGSSCKTALPGELSHEEAMDLCDQLGELGLKWVTVSGGEPLLRDDWDTIAKRLHDNGVNPLIISNGWMLNEEIIKRARDAGIDSFAISLDGIRETHDFMRMPGSFDRVMKGFDLLENSGLVKSAITTVTRRNIGELPALKQILLEKGVSLWQLQIGLPMGNFENNNDLMLDPEQVDTIIDFAYDMINEKRINVYLADCIGYYNRKETEVRKKTFGLENVIWQGCNAGRRSLGILHNGDILGCTSIRDREFIEGNIRNSSLKEIWTGQNSFAWIRDMRKEMLTGFCTKCGYGDDCLGGCPNTRLTVNKSIYSENQFCTYNIAMQKSAQMIADISDSAALLQMADKFVEQNEFQLAELVLSKALALEENPHILNYYGFVSFMLRNYSAARKVNEKVLDLDEANVYANKGMGLTLTRLGELDQGLDFLRKATKLTDADYMHPFYDLALTLFEHNRMQEAQEVLEAGKTKNPAFKNWIGELEKAIQDRLYENHAGA